MRGALSCCCCCCVSSLSPAAAGRKKKRTRATRERERERKSKCNGMREKVKEKKEKRKFELLSAFEAYKPFPPLSEQKQKERRGLLDSLLFQASFSLLSLFSLPLHARPCFELGRVVCVEGEAERAGRNEKREASKLSSSLPAGRSRKASLRTTASILPHFFEERKQKTRRLSSSFFLLFFLSRARQKAVEA